MHGQGKPLTTHAPPWKLLWPNGSPSTAWQGLAGSDLTIWLVREHCHLVLRKGPFVYTKEMKYSLALGKLLLCSQYLSA